MSEEDIWNALDHIRAVAHFVRTRGSAPNIVELGKALDYAVLIADELDAARIELDRLHNERSQEF